MDIGALQLFVAVIEHGSYSAASGNTGTPRSTLRRRIEGLEAEFGTPLLVRKGAGLVPTVAGEWLIQEAGDLVERARSLVGRVRTQSAASGPIHIRAPVGLPPQLMAMLLGQGMHQNPDVQVTMSFAEDPLQGLSAGIDVVLWFGAVIPHGPYVTRVVLSMPERLVASTDYLEAHGTPQTVDELAGHPLLCWSAPGQEAGLLPLRAGGAVRVAPRFASSDVHLVRSLAAAGLGIALVPDAPVAASELGGRIVPVLDDLVGREVALRVVLHEARAQHPRVRAALDVLGAVMA